MFHFQPALSDGAILEGHKFQGMGTIWHVQFIQHRKLGTKSTINMSNLQKIENRLTGRNN